MSFSNQGFGGVFDVDSFRNSQSNRHPRPKLTPDYNLPELPERAQSPSHDEAKLIPSPRPKILNAMPPEDLPTPKILPMGPQVVNKFGQIVDDSSISAPVSPVQLKYDSESTNDFHPSPKALSPADLPNTFGVGGFGGSQPTEDSDTADLSMIENPEQPVVDQELLQKELFRINENYRSQSESLDAKIEELYRIVSQSGSEQPTVDHSDKEHPVTYSSDYEGGGSIKRADLNLGLLGQTVGGDNQGSDLDWPRSFYFGNSRSPILFGGWQPDNYRGMFGACSVAFFAAVFWFLLISTRKALLFRFPSSSKRVVERVFHPPNYLHALMSTLTLVWGMFILMVALTFNGWLFLSLAFGGFVGSLLFGYSHGSMEELDPKCLEF